MSRCFSNRKITTGEKHLQRYSKTARVAARYMDRQLEDYAIVTKFCLEQRRFNEMCLRSGGLLHKLIEDDPKSERELDANSEDIVHLILALKYLEKEGMRSHLSVKRIKDYYKEVMSHLQGVREELISLYSSETQ